MKKIMYDIVTIRVQAGKGGDGAITFRREKFVPFGGPDGGDGGNGGNVVLLADPTVTNFNMYSQLALFKALKGGNGQRQKKHGKNGENLVLRVPEGTTVYEQVNDEERAFLADLEQSGQEVTVAVGGKGGWGNIHYATSTNQTPRLAQIGEVREAKTLLLELRLIADIGIIGYPNVGKSSLLSAASAAKPRIADYPFTTRAPELGVVNVAGETLVLAEIPGLIEGAHQGKGLGYDFLRHSTRTKAFIHLVDGSSPSPVEDMVKVNNELALYDPVLMHKRQIVVVNKIDLPAVRARQEEIAADFKWIGISAQFISAATGEGVPELLKEGLDSIKKTALKAEPLPVKVFRPQPEQPGVSITKEGGIFVIHAPDIERVVARVDMANPAVLGQVCGLLIRKGIGRMLEKAGIKSGNRVRCGNAEWDW